MNDRAVRRSIERNAAKVGRGQANQRKATARQFGRGAQFGVPAAFGGGGGGGGGSKRG